MRAVEPSEEQPLVRRTLRALLLPRRLVPIVVVSAPLVAAQAIMSADPLALPLGLVMCLAFVLVSPVSYRVLFPEGLEFGHGAIRVLLYGTVGAGVVLILGAVVPKVLDMGDTLLTARPSLVACAALFLVGGWGLGRDVEFEARLGRERARADGMAREAERAQLLALRAHLDPHFLFNTLGAIAEWCREDGETAERAVLQLASLLRAILAGVRAPAWPLCDEVELVRSLLALHLLRDPERFAVRIDVPPAAQAVRVPPMLLLPLADNAVKHGPAAGHRGAIALSAALDGDTLHVALASPGPYGGPRAGSDGLPTLGRRLALAYGGAASLTIGPDGPGGGTRVALALPASGPVDGGAL